MSNSAVDTAFTSGTQTFYHLCVNNAAAATAGTGSGSILIEEMRSGAGVDYAEVYYSKDNTIRPGEVVSIDNTLHAGVKRSNGAYAKDLLGIVSTRPGQVLSEDGGEGTSVILALAGRVPVKVNGENGAIHVGDRLTSSSTPGVAMKAVKAGPSIGVAMTAFDGNGQGEVLTFVNSAWYSGDIASLLPGGLNADGTEAPPDFSDNHSSQILAKLKTSQAPVAGQAISDIFADRVVAGMEIVTPKLTADKVRTNTVESITGSGVDVKLGDNETLRIKNGYNNQVVSFDASGNAQFKGDVSADKVRSNQIVASEVGQRYYTNDASIENGDVVAIDTADLSKIKKSDVPHSHQLVGVATTSPSLLLDRQGDGASAIVAVAGRVSVKVSAQNGPIQPGDALTSSSIPGVAMKASGGDSIIGKAVMGYSGTDVTKILVAVNNGYSGDNTLATTLTSLQDQINTLQTKVTDLATKQPQQYSTSGAVDANGQPVDFNNLAVGKITVNLDLIVKGAFVVEGPATFKEAARFQSDANFEQNVTVQGDTNLQGHTSFGNDTAGFATVKLGQQSIIVTFTKPFAAPPVITLSLGDGKFATYSYRKVTANSFEIILKDPATEDLTFSWTALSVNNPKTVINQ